MPEIKKTLIQQRFNRFLEKQMKEKGWSLRELARRADIAPSYLSHLKTFKNNIPSNEKLYQIAEALEIDKRIVLLEAGRAPEDDIEMIGLMRKFGELDAEERKTVLGVINSFRKVKQ